MKHLIRAAALGLLALCCALPAQATVRQVLTGSADGFLRALDQSVEGDIIEAGGDFPAIKANGTRFTVPGKGVVIRPAPGQTPTFASFNFQSMNGVHLERLRILGNVRFAALTNSSLKYSRLGAEPIPNDQIRNLMTKAMDVTSSKNIEVIGNEIAYVGSGFSIENNDGIVFDLNDTHHFRADAYRGYSSNIKITRNIVSDLFRLGDEHVDGVQMWTTGLTAATAQHDVLIEDNWLAINGGEPFQGIFIGNERKIANQNITVRRNMSAAGQWNAIYISYWVGVTMTDNTVVGEKGAISAGQQMTPWIKTPGSTNVVSSGNVVLPLMDRGALDQATALRRAVRKARVAAMMAGAVAAVGVAN